MCGIFAYLNHLVPATREKVLEILINGLQRLEYKGYDSTGLALEESDGNKKGSIRIVKQVGKVSDLADQAKASLDLGKSFISHVGIAHTRWATHGQPSISNAHPQRSDTDNEFVIVHNGTITNYKDIRSFLIQRDYKFESETDTEVVVKLIKYMHDTHENQKPAFSEIIELAVAQLEGAFAIVVISKHYPGELVATSRGSPLIIGVKSKSKLNADHFPVLNSKDMRGFFSGSYGRKDEDLQYHPIGPHKEIEYFFTSDPSCVIEYTNQVIYLEENDIASVHGGVLDIHRGSRSLDERTYREVCTLKMELEQIMKGSYSSFLQKEIFEQPESVVNTMRGRVNFDTKEVVLGGLKEHIREIRRCRRLLFIAAGTSYHSAIATRQLLEELTELPVMVELSSDFMDRKMPVFRDDVVFFLSQSGETADTLQALRYCKQRGSLIVGITNEVGSSISRESVCGVHLNAGPEMGVASTKTYTSHIIALVMFSLVMCDDRLSMRQRRNEIIEGLRVLPDQIRTVLALDEKISCIAEKLHTKKSVLVMARGYNYATCLEGALKIKELTNIHSEGILGGELKHGPLALIDQAMPVLMVCMRDKVFPKSINALEQVKARKGEPILLCTKGDTETQALVNSYIEVPQTIDCLQNLLTVIPLQLLSLHMARLRNLDTDRPRHLLKTYTS
ncbi:hypothetical protein RRG08_013694 [Elysia crispata]|uniref:glutamine--fructose-6-phosphate transaminase (isomerizing) n=1 Tax=Elysia crispata TaxID=231223 RepID=A0AAE0ZMF6_9GAST|nr:hypothetical protein RRG08_013694 [Elysia crispata]